MKLAEVEEMAKRHVVILFPLYTNFGERYKLSKKSIITQHPEMQPLEGCTIPLLGPHSLMSWVGAKGLPADVFKNGRMYKNQTVPFSKVYFNAEDVEKELLNSESRLAFGKIDLSLLASIIVPTPISYIEEGDIDESNSSYLLVEVSPTYVPVSASFLVESVKLARDVFNGTFKPPRDAPNTYAERASQIARLGSAFKNIARHIATLSRNSPVTSFFDFIFNPFTARTITFDDDFSLNLTPASQELIARITVETREKKRKEVIRISSDMKKSKVFAVFIDVPLFGYEFTISSIFARSQHTYRVLSVLYSMPEIIWGLTVLKENLDITPECMKVRFSKEEKVHPMTIADFIHISVVEGYRSLAYLADLLSSCQIEYDRDKIEEIRKHPYLFDELNREITVAELYSFARSASNEGFLAVSRRMHRILKTILSAHRKTLEVQYKLAEGEEVKREIREDIDRISNIEYLL